MNDINQDAVGHSNRTQRSGKEDIPILILKSAMDSVMVLI